MSKSSMAESKLADGRKIRNAVHKIDGQIARKTSEIRRLRRDRKDAIRQLLDLHAEPDDPPLDFDDGHDAA